MTPSDYQVIEDQLLRRNLAARDLLTTQALRAQGWSSSHLGKAPISAPLGRCHSHLFLVSLTFMI